MLLEFYLFSYIFSLSGMLVLSLLSQEKEFFYRIWSRLDFFRRALLSHGITILMWVMIALFQNAIKSFSDLFFLDGLFHSLYFALCFRFSYCKLAYAFNNSRTFPIQKKC
jgi:hypothetical protein